MIGSDADFGGRKDYFKYHGDYEILDYNYAKDGISEMMDYLSRNTDFSFVFYSPVNLH